ncbi:adenylyltransferase/cytidyltransferase family protein [bacterium]|nr:adenylyltransferase/cytidyltransferase family protein [bacterium]
MARFLTGEELIAEIRREKADGKKVVFANGAFDLLHVGHLRYLHGAAELGDVLVVALNSDASVRSLKGEGRPILPLEERVALVSAIEGVDYVTSFDEPKVTNLLLALEPHIHAKGTDYTRDNVPEVETVRSYGGEVAITGDPKDHNTTDIIAAIRAVGGE